MSFLILLIFSQLINLPDTLFDFGSLRLNSQRKLTLRIVNVGSSLLIVDSIRFSVGENVYFISPDTTPISVPPYGEKRINLWFWAPTIPGNYNAQGFIYSNAINLPIAHIHLRGQSVPYISIPGAQLWSIDVTGSVYEHFRSIKRYPDITYDGVEEVLGVNENDTLYLIGGNGHLTGDIIWKSRTGTCYTERGMFVTQDINNDGFHDIILGTVWGDRKVKAISGRTGEILWVFDTRIYGNGGWVYEVSPFIDLNNDSINEVLASCGDDGNATGPRRGFLLNGRTGQIIWERFVNYSASGIRKIPDLNNDGVPDVVITTFDGSSTAYNVFVVSGINGNTLWMRNIASYGAPWTAIPVGDVNNDGICDLVVGTSNYVIGLSGLNGNVLWSINVNGFVVELDTLNDTNNDGFPEVLPAGTIRNAYSINPRNGTTNWICPTPDMVFSMTSIPDVNGDNVNDVIVGTGYLSNYLMLLDGSNGSTLLQIPLPSPAEVVSWVSSMDLDNSPDIIVGTRNGMIIAFATGIIIYAREYPIQPQDQTVILHGTNTLTLQISVSRPLLINIFNSSGQLLYSFTLSTKNNSIHLNLENLPNGVYFIKLSPKSDLIRLVKF